MKSMTGFGRYILEDDTALQQWEIKSVNNKRLDIKWALPPVIRNLESRLEKTVKKHASRGRLEITLTLQFSGSSLAPRFDTVQAAGMLDALAQLAQSRDETFVPNYNTLLSLPELWGAPAEDIDEVLIVSLEKGLHLALDDWNEARDTEGAALARDLLARILRMEEWTQLIRDRAPIIKQERSDALHERITETLSTLAGCELEEGRFLQELTLLMDRLDVTEELTRLTTHLERLRELLQEDADAGRRLDFTLQECFREINTCGNKIPDVQLSRLVVDYKNELEKCREQVQNLE